MAIDTFTCQLTTFRIQNPPVIEGVTSPHEWMALATTHVYDPEPDPRLLSPEGAILSGAVMRVIEGRVSASTQLAAMHAAVDALMFQLDALRAKGKLK